MTTDLLSDIPEAIARAAYSGVSFNPERRAAQTQQDYVNTLTNDYAQLCKVIANKPEMRETMESEFARYREGYKARTLAFLHSSSRCVSSFIVGPSNFPVRRMEKRQLVVEKRLNELIEFRKRAMAAIIKTLCPELRPIMAGDSDAVEALEAKLEQAKKFHEHMKAANAAFRAFTLDPASLESFNLPDTMKKVVRDYTATHTADFLRLYPVPFMPFKLTNNSANIRRMEKRLAVLKRAKAAPIVEREGENGIRLEDCPADNRVRLFFPGKPNEAVRSRLKQSGFRWSPTIGAWQAYRNHSSIQTAKKEAGVAL